MDVRSDPALDLAAQVCTELAGNAPQGFHFNDHLIRQDATLHRLVGQLRSYPDRSEVERAISHALSLTRDGWTRLKLVELVDQLSLVGAAPALLTLVRQSDTDSLRTAFLAGRACEVLLRLPLDLQMRTASNEVCAGPLKQMVTFRAGAQRERQQQRPRRIEWLVLLALMLLALGGMIFALSAIYKS